MTFFELSLEEDQERNGSPSQVKEEHYCTFVLLHGTVVLS